MTVGLLTIGYMNYLVLLCAMSGGMLLVLDTRLLQQSELQTENKLAKFFGWLYLILAAALVMIGWLF